MKLLYVTFVDWGDQSSGSSARPHRMYEAFEALGCKIWLLQGCQSRVGERRRRVREALRALSCGPAPDMCYVEPPSGPFFCRLDLKLLKRLHGMGVPIALFYRDAHWRYAGWWGAKGVKRRILVHMHKRDLRVFRRCCDTVYFPGESMRRLFGRTLQRSGLLPPAAESAPVRHLSMIGPYMSAACRPVQHHMLKPSNCSIRARKAPAFNRSAAKMNGRRLKARTNRPWLTVSPSGRDLSLFERADVGIIPIRRDKYMDFALCRSSCSNTCPTDCR